MDAQRGTETSGMTCSRIECAMADLESEYHQNSLKVKLRHFTH